MRCFLQVLIPCLGSHEMAHSKGLALPVLPAFSSRCLPQAKLLNKGSFSAIRIHSECQQAITGKKNNRVCESGGPSLLVASVRGRKEGREQTSGKVNQECLPARPAMVF